MIALWGHLVALIALSGAQLAAAQPAPRPTFADPDAEAELRSALWDSALTPNEASVDKALERVNRLLISRDAREAVSVATQALSSSPKDVSLLLLRGAAYAALRDWSRCTADYKHALSPLSLPAIDRTPVRRDALSPVKSPDVRSRIDALTNPNLQWAICNANVGDLVAAENVLLHALGTAAVRQPNVMPQEIWLRLGEVQLQQGRIRDAVATLSEIAGYQSVGSMAAWLQVLAYDRERNVKQAQNKAIQALTNDVALSNLRAAPSPMFAGTDLMMFGLAWQTKLGQERSLGSVVPGRQSAARERATAYFRAFVLSQPSSAFLEQAQRHLTELQSNAATSIAVYGLPTTAKAKTAMQPINLVRAAVAASLPSLRACTASVPTVVFTVRKVVPRLRSERSIAQGGILASAQTTVTAGPFIEPFGDADAQLRATDAKACIERQVSHIPMPSAATANDFTIEFAIIAAQDKASAVPSQP